MAADKICSRTQRTRDLREKPFQNRKVQDKDKMSTNEKEALGGQFEGKFTRASSPLLRKLFALFTPGFADQCRKELGSSIHIRGGLMMPQKNGLAA
jgi:hypothetical protein